MDASPRRRRGRPSKKTLERQDTIIRAIQNYAHSIEEAADLAGVNRSTVYDWLDQDPTFSRHVAEARAKLNGLLKQTAIRRSLGYWQTDPVTGQAVLHAETGRPIWVPGDNRLLQFCCQAMAGLRVTAALDLQDGNIQLVSNVPRPPAELSEGQDEADLVVLHPGA